MTTERFPNLAQRLQNSAASLMLMLFFAGIYTALPYFQRYFSHRTAWAGKEYSYKEVLLIAMAGYACLLLVFYLVEKSPRISKSIICLAAIKRFSAAPCQVWRAGFTQDERLGLLSVLLKGFFAPLMVVWLFDHTATLLNNGLHLIRGWQDLGVSARALIGTEGYWFLFRLILFVDVFFFTLGYLIELPRLKNEIRSVDPTLLGWSVALACYPPFNSLTGSIFGWHSSDFPQFVDYPLLHLIANSLLLGLMTLYSWASLALNFKASNLTHRGIVAHGPYRFVRHPAYVCKNLAWWIGLGPALIVASQGSWQTMLLTVGSMLGWSTIYVVRALTEEEHLRSVDGTYDQYCQKVKYRFIPYVV